MASRARNIAQPDFALFGLRWLIPLAVLVDGLGKSAAGDPEAFTPAALAIIFGSAAYNLGVLMALNTGQWRLAIAMVTVTIDTLLSIAIVALVGPSLVWVALLPIVVAGGRFGWLSGLILAGMLVFGAFGMTIVMQGGQSSADTLVQLGMAAVLLPLAALASGVVSQSQQLHSGAAGRSERLDRQLRAAREQIRVIYEMAATLSTSLNYSRVLDMVLEVSVHGLERLGVSSRISAAVLLFGPENGKMVLRVAAHRRITPADARATVPGLEGAIGRALKQAEPVTTYNPHDDPELKYFAGFRESEAVLCVPMRAGFDSYGVTVVGVQERRRFRDDHIEMMQTIANQAIVSLQNASLYQNMLEEKERIVGIEEEARKQLARDLHDGPTQTVSAIAMRVSFIRRLLETKPEQAADELWKVEELARRAAADIRHMLFTLRPLVLESQGLVAALQQLADKMLETHNQKVTVEAEPNCEQALDKHAQGVIFYIVEEAVTNARKHAQADMIAVRMSMRSDVVVIEIQDNGRGFDVQAVQEGYEDLGSLGMINMRERAQLIEGTLHIDSAPGKGTRVSVLVPLQRSGGKLPTARGHT